MEALYEQESKRENDLKDLVNRSGSEVSAMDNSASGVSHSDSCAICFDTYRGEAAPYTLTACAHSFHRECIKKFWRHKVHEATCPLCRHSYR